MIARLLRAAWIAALAIAAGATWASVHYLGPLVGPWVAGLGALMALGALHPAAIGIQFVASRIAGDPVPEPFRLNPWQAIAMYDAEIDASLRGFWFATPFTEARAAPRPVEPTRPLALLFVHGYFCNRAVWHSFLRDAAGRGYRCEAVTLDDPLGTIDGHADAIDRAIDRLGGGAVGGVAIVAHSMGGLVARAALQRIDAARVAHVVTLGTPHRGTHAARFGRHPGVVEMRRDGAWLAALAAREAGPGAGLPRAAYTTIFSYHDDVVYPQTSACLDGAECVAIGGCGHVSLLYDRRVRTIVFERLDALCAAAQPAVEVS